MLRIPSSVRKVGDRIYEINMESAGDKSLAEILLYYAPWQVQAAADKSWLTVIKNGAMELLGVFLFVLVQLLAASLIYETAPVPGAVEVLIARILVATLSGLAIYAIFNWRRAFLGHRSLNPALSLALIYERRVSLVGFLVMAVIQYGTACLAALAVRAIVGFVPLPSMSVPPFGYAGIFFGIALLTMYQVFSYIYNSEASKIDRGDRAEALRHERRVNTWYAVSFVLSIFVGTAKGLQMWVLNPAVYLALITVNLGAGANWSAHVFAPIVGSVFAVVANVLLHHINHTDAQDAMDNEKSRLNGQKTL